MGDPHGGLERATTKFPRLKILITKDSGHNWSVQDSTIDTHFQDITVWDDKHAVAVGNFGRVVVTAAGLIHDSGPNSTAGLTTDDTEGAILFKIGEREYCPRTSAEMIWNEGVLNFHVFGWGPVLVRRYMEGEQLIWEYADGSITPWSLPT